MVHSRHRTHSQMPRRCLCASRSGALLAVAAMWTGLLFQVVFALPVHAAQATVEVRGVVVDPTGEPVAGATVQSALPVDGAWATTDEDGRFALHLPPGVLDLEVIHPEFKGVRASARISVDGVELELRLEWITTVEESVAVVGIRAGDDVPVTKRNMTHQEIEMFSHGQDTPALLQHTPSITWYSDSGAGSNYSYLSLRGIQQSRINITLDGAPLNDPADHALFFNNFSDFTSAVDSIQIQRGVGTSSVGSPSYGGSINFASPAAATRSGGDARVTVGAYDTQRVSLGYESGVLGSGFHLGGRFSYANTDGYRDRSGSEHRTVFANAGWRGERDSLKLFAFFGKERSQLSFLAVDPDTLSQNRRFNALDSAERDDFGQDFAQLKYTRVLGDDGLLTASAYYNGAQGWFRIWDDPAAQSNLLQFGIDQQFYGSTITLSKNSERFSASVGAHYNDFSGDHDLQIGDDASTRLYVNTGFKQTANVFGKIEYRLSDNWLLYGDLQLRYADFSYEGDIDLGSVSWTFLDPKVGARVHLAPSVSAYASVGRAQREPGRLDMLSGEDNATVRHDLEAVRVESVVDFEAGVNVNTRRWSVQANVYAMEFRDEIALTGELSDIGLPLRRNVDTSYRRGIELDLRWRPAPNWSAFHSLNISSNRIREWTQFIDVYDADGAFVGSEPTVYVDVEPLLTPGLIANLGIEWTRGETSLMLVGRHVAESQLDNTNVASLRLPSYTNLDLRASFGLERWAALHRPRLVLFVNNLVNSDNQFGSGYSYQFVTRGTGGDALDGIPFYYPLATRNVVVSLQFDF